MRRPSDPTLYTSTATPCGSWHAWWVAFIQRHKLAVGLGMLIIALALFTFAAVGIFDLLDELKRVTKDFD